MHTNGWAVQRDKDGQLRRIADMIGCTPSELRDASNPLAEAAELLGLFQGLDTPDARQAVLDLARRLAEASAQPSRAGRARSD